jgi:hypothetical protein
MITKAIVMLERKPGESDTEYSERRWDDLFARSPELLEKLADEAIAEHQAGLTEELDPDKL